MLTNPKVGDIVRVIRLAKNKSDRQYDKKRGVVVGCVGIVNFLGDSGEDMVMVSARFDPLASHKYHFMYCYQLEVVDAD